MPWVRETRWRRIQDLPEKSGNHVVLDIDIDMTKCTTTSIEYVYLAPKEVELWELKAYILEQLWLHSYSSPSTAFSSNIQANQSQACNELVGVALWVWSDEVEVKSWMSGSDLSVLRAPLSLQPKLTTLLDAFDSFHLSLTIFILAASNASRVEQNTI